MSLRYRVDRRPGRAPLVAACLALLAPACRRSATDGPATVLAEPEPIAARPPAAPAAGGPSVAELGEPSVAVGPVPAELAAGVELARIARGFARPVGLESAPGDAERLFVVEQGGRIRILRAGAIAPRPFLDLSGQVSRDHDERGLLGLAFAPDFAATGRLYVNFTDRKGGTRVVEYRVDPADADRADPASAREVFALAQPYANHNGGGLEFGPDGRLYVGTGDGGAAGDPRGAGQDDGNRLAKLLALDVASGAVTVVAKGLRNPWRYAFDPATGDLYLADVGQDRWEEVDVVPFAALPGANFGWNLMEGSHCFRAGCDPTGLVLPAVEYDHQTGCSVTGGEIYRGSAIAGLDGAYFYADYCTGLLRSFRWRGGQVYQHWDWKPAVDPDFKLATLSSFGHDHAGELYLLSLDGDVYKLRPR